MARPAGDRGATPSTTPVLRPAFLVVNIADILCFADESIPRVQGGNAR